MPGSGQSPRLAAFRYDTTRALLDGEVRVDGADDVTVSTADALPQIFAAILGGQVDVAELGLTFYLRSLEDERGPIADPELIALPVFPARIFRHSCVFVNTHAGIDGPADLAGRTIGEWGVYGQDSGIWAKGVLTDDYGFDPAAARWVIGGLDAPAAPFGFTRHIRPKGVHIEVVEDRALGELLERGEIDALMASNIPQRYLDGSPNVARLFPDYERVEHDWYRRTGIFPMMHVVVARRDLIAQNPALARRVYDAFDRSRGVAAGRYERARRLQQVTSLLPWTNRLYEDDRAFMGEDWWPYGLAANRTALETFLRYHHEQGLSGRRWTPEEIFAPELLDS